MIKNSPCPVDVQDLQFKLKCKLKIFDNNKLETFPNSISLVSCASRYGLLFVGTNSNILQVIQLKSLENCNPKDEILNYPRRNVPLPSQPRHISVNCDSTILAVVIEKDKCPTVLFYNVQSFLKQNISLIKEVRLSATPNTFVCEVNWNPALPTLFTACKSDGTLGVYEVKESTVDINELPAAAAATCFCWSPRGKQVAVGSKDGKITQYKPDLKAVKVINSPNLSKPHSLISLQWISNFQFIGVYLSNEGQCSVIVVDAPKTGELVYTNYDDICYSGSNRYAQYYTILMQQWGILMAASSNGTEVGVLGNSGDVWTQWIMIDTSRAELPLSAKHEETFPLGMALDTSSTQEIPWGEGTIPPTPLLLVLSHHGLLCIFNIVYFKDGVPSICSPPEPLQDVSGLSLFITEELKTQQTAPLPQLAKAPIQQFPSNKPNTSPILNLTPNVPSVSSTPLKPQTSQQPITLFGGQSSIIPISKQIVATTAPSFGISYSVVTTTPTKPTSTTVYANTSTLYANAADVPLSKSGDFGVSSPIVTTPTKSEHLPNQDEIDAMLAKLIKDEFILLETQVNDLLNQGRLVKMNVGTDVEKTGLIKKIESLEMFLKDLRDINIGQSAEVHCLKQNLIQSWAWYEEANSKFVASKDETITLLLRAEPLDMASEKHLKNIKHSVYYLESQLSQASKALDEQWDNFQDYAKKTHRSEMPTMEAIFQTMVQQNAIIEKQRYILKDISSRLRGKSRNMGFSLIMAGNSTKQLQNEMQRLYIDQQDIHQMQYERVLNRNKLLTKNKMNKLRNILTVRNVMHVTAIKPQLSSSILQQSPASKSKHLISILGAQMSPVPKNAPVKVLDFVQSTPKPETVKVAFEQVTPPSNVSAVPFSVLPAPSFTAVTQSMFQQTTTLPSKSQSTSLFWSSKENVPATTSSVFSFAGLGTSVPKTISAPVKTDVKAVLSSFSFTPSTSAFATGVSTDSSKNIFNFGAKSSESTIFSKPTVLSPPSNITVTKANDTNETIIKAKETTKSQSTSLFETVSASATTTKSIVFGTNKSIFSSTSSTPKSPESGQIFSVSVTTPQSPISLTPSSKPLSAPIFEVSSSVDISSQPSKSIFGLATSVGAVSSSTGIGLTQTSLNTVSDNANATSIFTSKPSTSSSVTKPTVFEPSSTFKIPSSDSKPSIFKVPSTTTTVTSKIPETITPSTQTPLLTLPQPTSITTTASSSIFATSVSSTTPPLSLFGRLSADLKTSTITTKPTLSPVEAASIFSQASTPTSATSAKTSIFAQPSVPTTTVSIFAQPLSIMSTTTTTSIFGSTTLTPSTTTTSIFGSANLSPSTTTTTTVFTQPLSSSSTSVAASTSIFAQVSSSTPPVTGATSVFAQSVSTPATTSITSTQVQATTPSSSSTVAFGKPVTTSASAAVFGQSTVATTPTTIFGQPAAFTTSATIFGQPAANTTSTSIFGQSAAVTSSTTVFGQSTVTTTSASPSIFHSSQPSQPFGSAQTTKPSIFGAVSSPTTQTTAFGLSNTSEPNPMFGTKTTSMFSSFGNTSTTSSSPFGSQPPPAFGTPTTTASMFGSPAPVFGGGSIFGNASQTTTSTSSFGQSTSPSVFGSIATSATTGMAFGSASSSSAFGNTAPVFGTPTSSTASPFGMNATTSSSVFGASPAQSFSFTSPSQPTSASGFGFGGLSMGSSTASGGTFGGGFTDTTAANPFAKAATMSTQKGSIFGTPATTNSTSIFGSNTATQGFGSFGSPPAFGQQQQQQQQQSVFQSAFGGQNASSFGSPQPGPFSGGGGGVGQAGFGSAATFQKPTGFGSPPVFGSASPSFGSAPTFGGAPTFGSAATFGSPQKVFGSNAGPFGSTNTQQSPSFGNLANQNTVGFGSLAQQASNANTNTPFAGNSSFSTWR